MYVDPLLLFSSGQSDHLIFYALFTASGQFDHLWLRHIFDLRQVDIIPTAKTIKIFVSPLCGRKETL